MPQDYLTQADVANYGTDLIDFTTRAAAHAPRSWHGLASKANS